MPPFSLVDPSECCILYYTKTYVLHEISTKLNKTGTITSDKNMKLNI